MNKGKWIMERNFVKVAAKLAEETGETVQEILNADEEGYTKASTLRRIEQEAAQVEFLAQMIRNRARDMRRAVTHTSKG